MKPLILGTWHLFLWDGARFYDHFFLSAYPAQNLFRVQYSNIPKIYYKGCIIHNITIYIRRKSRVGGLVFGVNSFSTIISPSIIAIVILIVISITSSLIIELILSMVVVLSVVITVVRVVILLSLLLFFEFLNELITHLEKLDCGTSDIYTIYLVKRLVHG